VICKAPEALRQEGSTLNILSLPHLNWTKISTNQAVNQEHLFRNKNREIETQSVLVLLFHTSEINFEMVKGISFVVILYLLSNIHL